MSTKDAQVGKLSHEDREPAGGEAVVTEHDDDDDDVYDKKKMESAASLLQTALPASQDLQGQVEEQAPEQLEQQDQQQEQQQGGRGVARALGPRRSALEPVQLLFDNEAWDPGHNEGQAELLRESIARVANAREKGSMSKVLELYRFDRMLVFLRLSHVRGVRHPPIRMETSEATSRKHKRDGLPCLLCCAKCENHPLEQHTKRTPPCTKFWCIEDVWDGVLNLAPCRNPDAINGSPFQRRHGGDVVQDGDRAQDFTFMVPEALAIPASAMFAAHASRKRPREPDHSHLQHPSQHQDQQHQDQQLQPALLTSELS
ncbi:Hypothetical Protein FCC1311_013102 [Hondaea fermentalgiana]|uniref:Uncharacterized protein n=1 Tax=Hondaea fermentalgiana TaxID=2315210 RepID=A0A2R5G9C9_9STRA|nr:Hypothetical Protein FCC1311_013102 [Hondaea fermentalgiana]|eukprot:GBG25093.1 Hypothetical Protein FCC1311_013102 [Hondaea fermentalgiana]